MIQRYANHPTAVCMSMKRQDQCAGPCMCESLLLGKLHGENSCVEGILVHLTAHTRPMRVYIAPSSSLSAVSAALSVKK